MTPDESNRFFAQWFAARRVMVILRGHEPEEALALATFAWDAGIDLVEVPIQGERGAAALAAVVAAGAERGKPVGAGTVTTPALADRAADLGARFTVAPGWSPEVAARSLDRGMPHVPGVATGTEVQSATASGLGWVKGFPASVLGPEWFTAMRGPFPEVEFMATGGVSPANAQRFLDAGASVVALGTAFAQVSAEELAAIR
jgi:2-dehydro-3-deoxyphosphogluconate aldolase/(4S)-4-hydroxy-2-oxoglutarate aldolase